MSDGSSVLSVLQRSHANEMLSGLRYFERQVKGDGGNQKVSLGCFFHALETMFWCTFD